MAFDPNTRHFEDNNQFARPHFIVVARNNVTHPVAMNHHRVPWSVLRKALNQVLDGKVDTKLLNALLSLSPTDTRQMVNSARNAIDMTAAGKRVKPNMVAALEAIEQEVFSLPFNLFLGLNQRADDPGDSMDFLPNDIGTGGLPQPAHAEVQSARERLYGLLRVDSIDASEVQKVCRSLSNLWGTYGPGLDTATAFTPGDWAPGAAPFAVPAQRHWPGLGLADIQRLTALVTARALKKAK